MFRHPMTSPISAAAVDGAFLQPGMEARARNLQQYDPSAAVDSHLERIGALALRLPPSPEREALVAEVAAAIASNVAEGEEELAIAGAADELVADLRHGERNGLREVLGAKAICRHLRGPLGRLAAPQECGVAELTDARHLVRATIAEVPRLMLLSAAVERELGAKKYAVLRELAEKSGARGREPRGGTEDERGSARHARA